MSTQDPAPENAESIILDYISEHPGADAEEIAEVNYIKIAFVEHHLKSLKKRHAVHSRMSGKVRRYYPIAAIDPPEPPIDDTVPPLSEVDPLTEEEERDVAISLQELADGKGIEMRLDETVKEFLDRQCDGPSCTVPESKTRLFDLCALAVSLEEVCHCYGYDCEVELWTYKQNEPIILTVVERKVKA